MTRHAERLRPPRDGLADPARPHDPEDLALQVPPEQQVRRPAREASRPHHPVAFDDPARQGEHQRDREVRRGVGQDVRRIGHHDSPRRGRRPVDLVDADGVARDDLEPVRRLDDGRGDGVVHEADERVDSRDLGGELHLARRVAEHADLEVLPQRVEGLRQRPRREHDAAAHRAPRCSACPAKKIPAPIPSSTSSRRDVVAEHAHEERRPRHDEAEELDRARDPVHLAAFLARP